MFNSFAHKEIEVKVNVELMNWLKIGSLIITRNAAGNPVVTLLNISEKVKK